MNFKGNFISTPNEPEASGALNVKITDDPHLLKTVGNQLLKRMESPAVLLTRGSKGMLLFEKGKAPFSIPVYGTTDIVDVTGAGDTVISVLTLALAAKANIKEASRLANIAGSLVVMKKGTACLTQEELKQAVVSSN